MVSKSDYTVLKTVGDVLGFLLVTIGYVIQSLVKACIPKSYKPVKNLDGKVVLVTGGGGGLGRLVALRLARMKAVVVLWDIHERGVEDTIKLVEGVGGVAYGYKCDISNRHDVYRVAEKTTNEVGPVSVLINNAGVASGKLLTETPDEIIQRTFDVNCIAHFWTVKAFLPKMIENNEGHIVTIASMAGHVGIKKMIDYCASKYAAVGFDEALRVELDALGVKGVKTTCICPYFIQATGMFNDVHSRFVPTLKANDVADEIIEGIVREKLIVTIPNYFRYCLWLKWIMPWAVVSLFLRNLVPDAAPSGGTNIGTPETKCPVIECKENATNAENSIKKKTLHSEKVL